MLHTAPFLVIDTETTGFHAHLNQIAELALVAVNYKMEITEEYCTYVQKYDNLKLEPKTMEFTGITEEEMESGISADDLYKELVDKFKKYKKECGKYMKPILVFHNASFDIPFVDYIFTRKDDSLFKYVEKVVQDTIFLSRMKYGHIEVSNHKLESACEREGVELSDAHSALPDTIATAKLFIAYISNLRTGKSTGGGEETYSREKIEFQF